MRLRQCVAALSVAVALTGCSQMAVQMAKSNLGMNAAPPSFESYKAPVANDPQAKEIVDILSASELSFDPVKGKPYEAEKKQQLVDSFKQQKDSYVKNFITEEALQSSSAKLVNEGDLLYALYGATSGEVAISKIHGAINQAVLCIMTNENKKFLFYFLRHNKEKIVQTYIQGGQGNLSAKIVKELKVDLPCKEEQDKIASFLSVIDEKIETEKLLLAQLQNQKKYFLQNMFI